MNQICTVLDRAALELAVLPHSDRRPEAELLLAEVLGKDRTYLFAWPERVLTPQQERAFRALLHRRLGGEPIAYILGHREFWSLQLQVTPAVLIPRPETELLVELALDAFPPRRPVAVADLGTGSGAVAAAIAHERPHWSVWATDVSAAALAVAKENFRRCGLDEIETRRGAWCAALPPTKRFDLIVGNPPYVAERDPHLERGDLPREPRSSLAAGPDGLDEIRRIVARAPSHLKVGGLLLLEHGFDQGKRIRALLRQSGFTKVRTRRDLADLDRVSGGYRGTADRSCAENSGLIIS